MQSQQASNMAQVRGILLLLFVAYGVDLVASQSGVKRAVICEHQRRNLNCGSGKVIKILKAVYGRNDRRTCPNKAIRTTRCAAPKSFGIVKGLCNRKNSCSLWAKNRVFGDPCVGTYKYLLVHYQCQPKNILPPGVKQTVICEHQRKNINCGSGKVIRIIKAVYGRKNRGTCPKGAIRTTNCAARKSLEIVGRSCNTKNLCSLWAKNSVFGDPCVGTYKYLLVRYRCQPKKRILPPGVKQTVICEHQRKNINCGSGKVIRIIKAVYGRKNRGTCPKGAIRTTNCAARKSLEIVGRSCNTKSLCSLWAKNSVFGDPCVGTYKYLLVRYRCQSKKKITPPGVKRAVICEHQKRNLNCGNGKVIKILKAVYGRNDRSTCPNKAIRTTRCAAVKSFGIVGGLCNRKNSCSLWAKNRVFGDPCVGTYKYLLVHYQCQPKKTLPPGVKQTVICEHQRRNINCGSGKVIRIIKAVYGRKNRGTCPKGAIRTTNCAARKSLEIVGRSCNTKSLCSLWAKNSVFGDPCVGTYKYLLVRYRCQSKKRITPPGVKRAVICEHQKRNLNCGNGKVIKILKAVYGRNDRSTCPNKAIRTTRCAAVKSFGIVGGLCNRKNSCSLWAKNRVFGDPCVGTYKYLLVHYQCQPKKTLPPGVKQTVICEHQRRNINCGSGKVIRIIKAVYGRKNRGTCPKGAIRTTNCAARKSLEIVGRSCNTKSLCSLWAKNSVFGDPCVGTYKYLLVRYRCQSKKRITPPGVKRAVICEHQKRNLNCGNGKVIKILKAVYGRNDRSTCPNKAIRTTRCAAVKSFGIVKGLCNRKNSCSLWAKNRVFGDPCVGTYKYLLVHYQCQPKKTPPGVKQTVICEHQRRNINCGSGKVIRIIKAVYGRKNRGTCPKGAIRTTNCAARKSLEIVGRSCNTKRSCSLWAKNNVFGDPCVGTYKYLLVRYQCQRKKRITPPGVKKSVICEHQRGNLNCGKGKVIRILTAVYGRSNKQSCPKGAMRSTKCAALRSLGIVRRSCDNRRTCSLWAKNKVFGDPCVGTYKYLFVRYVCQQRKQTPAVGGSKCLGTKNMLCPRGRINRRNRNRMRTCRVWGAKKALTVKPVAPKPNCVLNKDYYLRGDKLMVRERCRGRYRVLIKKAGSCESRQCSKAGGCRCKAGYMWDEAKNSCYRPCRCTGSGDPHFKTYSGNMIHFMGVCTYILSESTIDDPNCGFNVYVKNERRGRNPKVSYVRNVYVKISNVALWLRKDSVIDQIHEHGLQRIRNFPLILKNGDIEVTKSGNYMTVMAKKCGITVKFDGRSVVEVSIPRSFEGKTTGLCGVCGRPEFDFTTSDGKKVSANKDGYAAIGDSYNVENEEDGNNAACKTTPFEGCKSTAIKNAILSNNALCGYMRNANSPFKKCFDQVDPKVMNVYRENCASDVCSTPDNKMESVCNSLEMFAEFCRQAGVSVSYRTNTFCKPSCKGKHMVYDFKMSACPATCSDPSAPQSCSEKTEGCRCKNGYVLSNERCVPLSECGCNFENGKGEEEYFQLGQTRVLDDCSTVEVCRKGAGGEEAKMVVDVRLRRKKCGRNAFCGYIKNDRKCMCKKGFIYMGIRGCIAPQNSCIKYTKAKACQAGRRRTKFCWLRVKNGRLLDVKLTPKNKYCNGRTYRLYGRQIMVKRGCRVAYTIKYVRRGGCRDLCNESEEWRNGKCRCKIGFRRGARNICVKNIKPGYSGTPTPINKVDICEHKSRKISCNRGQVIRIRSAVYGRSDRKTCPSRAIKSTKCAAKTSLVKVKGMCNNKRECILRAKNNVFGDPCYGTYKYLRVRYQCRPAGAPIKKFDICEHKSRKISCRIGYVINIRSAVYGRSDRKTCPSRAIKTTKCFAKKSLQKVRGMCNNKRECILRAKNNVFGDPCYGTYKYLRVRYQCKPAGIPTPACTKMKNVVCPPRNGRSRNQNKKYYCRVRGAVKAISMELRSQLKGQQCLKGRDFYVKGNKIVVKGKCQGRYGVIIRPRGGCKGKCGKNAIPRRNGRGCQCKRGFQGDAYSICTRMCMCRAAGDPHYKTFGNKKIDFMGICRYILSEYEGDNKCKFSIEEQNERRGRNQRVSYVKDVFVNIGEADIMLGKGGKVYINNEEGYEEVTNFPRSMNDGDIEIEKSGRYAVVSSASCGIKVRFDGKSVVSVAVPTTFAGKTTGVCGNCGRPELDYTTSEGVDVSGKKNRDELIVNSYLADDQQEAKNCKATAKPFIGCKNSNERNRMLQNKKLCGLMQRRNSPFAECLQKATDEEYNDMRRACADDVCSTPDTQRETVCIALDNLEKYCSDEHQINVGFRTNSFCPMSCPNNMIFDNDVRGCPKTCSDPNPTECDEPSSDGCTCPPNLVRSGNKCVKEADCGCTEVDDNGDQKYYELGAMEVMDDCSTVKVCKKDNSGKARMIIDESKRRPACHPDAKCIFQGKQRKCVCKKGMIDNGKNQCIEPRPTCIRTTRRRVCRSKGGRIRRCRIGLRFANIINIKIQQLNNNCKKANAFGIRNRRVYVRQGCNVGFTVSYVPRGGCRRCPKGLKWNKGTRRCERVNFPGNPPLKTVDICEHRSMKISCKPGYVIKIRHAVYGRSDRKTCRSSAMKNTRCFAKNSIQKVRGKCENKKECTLFAKNQVFGDPCYGTFKYLKVRYYCKPSGIKKVVVCERKSGNINCGNNKVIRVISANYGRMNRNTCPGAVKTTRCRSTKSLPVVLKTCNNRKTCRLTANNRVYGDPCVGTYKYLIVRYKCKERKRNPPLKTVDICEHRSMKISCKPGYVIKVRHAVYGRSDRKTCRSSAMKNTRCFAKNSIQKVRGKCENKKECTLVAKNQVFGDPCYGTFKYLKVRYYCKPSGVKKAVVCERKSGNINCGNNKVIRVISANYGRMNRNTCPGAVKTTRCRSTKSLPVVLKTCNNRKTCRLTANNRVYGDPCVGTYKYLIVRYKCKERKVVGSPACTKMKNVVCPPRNGRSRNRNKKYSCRVRGAAKAMSLELRSQLKGQQCLKGRDYYVRGNRIVVKGKCQGRYGVIIRPRGGCRGKCGVNAVPRRRGRGCVCKPRYQGDPYSMCKKMCECRASGDPHYMTFGRKKIDFMGICRYTLSEYKGDGKCKFSIEEQNERRGRNQRVSYVKDVFVNIGEADIMLGKGGKVYINNEDGYEEVTTFPRSMNDGDIEIEKSGRYAVVSSASCGIKVRFDGKSVVSVAVPTTFAGKTTGVCGNCGRPELDYTTSEGVDVSGKKNRDELIVNSYLADEQQGDIKNCKATVQPFKGCKDSNERNRMLQNKKLCGLMQRSNSPFAECLQKATDEEYNDMRRACADDVCSTPDTQRETVCIALDNLEKYCSEEHQINVGFRTNSFCPMSCPNNMIFDNDVSGCPKTCSDPNPTECDEPSSDGCTCPPNLVRSGNKCVKEAECGCTEEQDNGDEKYYELGQTMVMEDCSTVKVCKKDNTGKARMMIDQSKRRPPCHPDAKCVFQGKQRKCVCKKGLIDNGKNQCLKPNPACVKTTRRRICRSRGGRTRRCTIGLRFSKFIDIKLQPLNNNCRQKNSYRIRNRWMYVRNGCSIGYRIKYVPRGRCRRCPKGSVWNRKTGTCQGFKQIVICEHQRRNLNCGKGKVIRILRAVYGRSNRKYCPKGAIRTTKCAATGSATKVRQACDRRTSCSLWAKNKVFGDPCVGTYKYLLVRYRCLPKKVITPPGLKTAVICEHQRRNLNCGIGKVVRILKAVYGRQGRRHCPKGAIRTTQCAANGSLKKVREACNSRRSCSLWAKNKVFGDPCVGTFKYLLVKYRCLPKKVIPPPGLKTAVICEHQRRNLNCGIGKVVRILKAVYGRQGRRHCPKGAIRTTQCAANGSLKKVRQACNWKRSCSLWAKNKVFGDPCVGTFKYLLVKYRCLPKKAIPPPGLKTAVICEHQRRNLNCGIGKVVRILKAVYGRQGRRHCPKGAIRTTQCAANGSLKKVRQACNWRRSCSLWAKNKVFGDPCVGTYKYLLVKYRCLPKKASPPPEPKCRYEEIRCESRSGNKKTFCRIKGKGRIRKIHILEGFPRASCIRNTINRRGTYGFKGKYVWVRNNCVGEFKVCLGKGAVCDPPCKNNARCVDGECKCPKGMVGNPTIGCFDICLCKAYGDVHFNTFDGQRIDFQGVCKYTLTELIDTSDKCYFHVKEQSETRGRNKRVSYMRYMEVETFGHTIKLDQRHNVKVDGRSVRLPYFSRTFVVYRYGGYTVLDSLCKMRVIWDGRSNGFVAISREYQGKVRGLCGNCNRDRNDDFVDKNNRKLGRNVPNRHVLIGDSFIVHDGSDKKPQCKSTPKPTACTRATKRFIQSVWCRNANIKNRRSPFAKCLRLSPDLAKEMYESCIYDGCATPRSQHKTVICEDYEQLAAACALRGLPAKNWRRKVGCVQPCPNRRTMRYVDILPLSQPNCASNENMREENGVGLHIGGCVCKSGYVLSGNTCVRKKDCGCRINGGYILVNEIWEDCSGKYKCVRKAGGAAIQVIKRKTPCDPSQDCFFTGKGYECRGEEIRQVTRKPPQSPELYFRSTAKVIYGREKLRKKKKPVPECGVMINGKPNGKSISIGEEYRDCQGKYKCANVGGAAVLQTISRFTCHISAQCVEQGKWYLCKCTDGYIGDGITCTPKEPKEPEGTTPPLTEPKCVKINGKPNGEKIQIGDEYSDCEGKYKCAKVGDKAVLNTVESFTCHISAECVKEGGNFVCRCNEGYNGNGKECTPEEPKGLPPVEEPECDVKMNGRNTGRKIKIGEEYSDCQGKYRCAKAGDKAVLNTVDSYTCHSAAKCVQEGDKYVCRCNEGYSGNGRNCDIVRQVTPKVLNTLVPTCSGCVDVSDVMKELTVNDIVIDNPVLNMDVYKDKLFPSNDAEFAEVSNIVTISIPGKRINCLHFLNSNTNIQSYNILASYQGKMEVNEVVTGASISSFTFPGNPVIDRITLTFTPINAQERIKIKPQILECKDAVGCVPECTDRAECKQINGNFQCVCDVKGYELDGVRCVDINECQRNTDDCKSPSTCKNTEGSFQCVCDRAGYKEVDNECVDIDECQENLHNCISPARCSNTQGSFRCVCLEDGFELMGNKCEDINECLRGTHECVGQAKCVNTEGAYMCKCDVPGYELNGRRCQDINECVRNTHTCKSPATCKNNEGSFTCVCERDGYRQVGDQCVDINECIEDKHNCISPAKCENTQGSFRCVCRENGYELQGDECVDIDECVRGTHKCVNQATCRNTNGSYGCECNVPGYELHGRACRDINECKRASHNCIAPAECQNTEGSFRCQCNKPGYQLDRLKCVDINECRTGKHNCKAPWSCRNRIGSFICVCGRGGKLVGKKCVDINECDLKTHRCHREAKCINTQGSYRCKCNPGYIGNGRFCRDENECRRRGSRRVCRGGLRCKNTIGSYECVCRNGYKRVGETCKKLCNKDVCHKYAVCKNLGRFRGKKCVCKRRYIGDGVESCGKKCGNTFGCDENAFCKGPRKRKVCTCKQGFVGTGRRCAKKCTCSVTGHPQIVTFDTSVLRINKAHCKYLLSKYNSNENPACNYELYIHTGQNVKTGVSVTRSAELHIYGMTIDLMSGGEVRVNGEKTVLPYAASNNKLFIDWTGSHVKVSTGCFLYILWRNHNLYVEVAKSFSPSLSGLCGDCDGKANEYMTSGGDDVSSFADKEKRIIDSYAAPIYVNNVLQECRSTEIINKCTRRQTRRAKSSRYCGRIYRKVRSSPFKRCMRKFPKLADKMYAGCKQDFCDSYDDKKNLDSIVCRAIEALYMRCRLLGYNVRWRRRRCRMSCPKNFRYSRSGKSRHSTCSDPSASRVAYEPRIEGCFCRGRNLLSGNKCVAPRDCGCSKDGFYYPLGFGRLNKFCDSRLVCKRDPSKKRVRRNRLTYGKLKTVALPDDKAKCHENAACGVSDGIRECVCRTGFIGDGQKMCKPVATCDLDQNTTDCISTVKMKGDCEYMSEYDQCKFSVYTVDYNGIQTAYATFHYGFDYARIILHPGQSNDEHCAKLNFMKDNKKLLVEFPVCDCPPDHP